LGTEIGITYYDLQGNTCVSNRMMVYSDGSISAVWTFAPDATASYPGRGTGYNHSSDGGDTWLPIPTARLEAFRTGWPNIGKTTDGAEVDPTHSATKGNLCITTDGGATWTSKDIGDAVLGLIWPRLYVNGNTIHIIANSTTSTPYHGFAQGALVYMKSTNNGDTWTTPIIPTGLDTSNYCASTSFVDRFSMAGKGNTIAIVYGAPFRTPCLVKSTDNGDHWSYTEIIHQPPSVKKFDTEGSQVFDINGDHQQDNILW